MRYALLLCLLLATEGGSDSSITSSGLIDVHAHIGSFSGFEIGEEILLENLRRFNIRFALVSNLDGANLKATKNLDEISANQETADLVRRNRNRVAGLLWARPTDGSAANLEKFLEEDDPVFVGIKFHPEFNQFAVDDSRVDAYLSLCEKYQLVAVFHCGRPNSLSDPEKIYAIARRHPRVPFVLYHMEFFGSHNHAIAVAAEAQQRKDALIYLETAQVEPSAVLEAIQKLGSDFVLFGTDATYYGRDHYAKYQKLLDTLQKNLNAEDYRKVTSGNAIRLFKLEAWLGLNAKIIQTRS